MKVFLLLASFSLGLLSVSLASAEVGFPFLVLGSGARGAALAEAMTALGDEEAASVNPAALRVRGRRTFALTHGAWVQDLSHDCLSLVFAGPESVWGIAAQIVQAEGIERRVGPTAEPLGTFGVYEGSIGVNYARPWHSRLWMGAGLKAIRQVVATQTASGAALDLGVMVALGDRLHLGAAVRNLGRMDELDREATPLPRMVRLGLVYRPLPSLLISWEAQQIRSRDATLHLGGEWRLADRLAVRGGYQTADGRGLSVGFGLTFRSWVVDYAFVPLRAGLGEGHRLGVQLSH